MLWEHRLFACVPLHLFYRLLLSVIPGKGTQSHTQYCLHQQSLAAVLLHSIPHYQELHLGGAHCKPKLICHERVYSCSVSCSTVSGQQGYIISKLTFSYQTFTCISGIPSKELLIVHIKYAHPYTFHITQSYRSNNRGAIVQPCRKLFSTSISFSISPSTPNLAFMLSWKDLMMSIRWSGTPRGLQVALSYVPFSNL